MKVLEAAVYWYWGFANSSHFKVLVDKIPSREELVYKKKGSLYFAELDGYVDFHDYNGPGEGYCGSVFRTPLDDGTVEMHKGPWSSRAGVMNGAGFTPCVDVLITDDPETWKRGYTFYGGAITVESLVDCILNRPFNWWPGYTTGTTRNQDDRYKAPFELDLENARFTMIKLASIGTAGSTDLSGPQQGVVGTPDGDIVYEPAIRLSGGSILCKGLSAGWASLGEVRVNNRLIRPQERS